MSDKAQAMIDELVAACIAFGRQVEPDWQTRIEDARAVSCVRTLRGWRRLGRHRNE